MLLCHASFRWDREGVACGACFMALRKAHRVSGVLRGLARRISRGQAACSQGIGRDGTSCKTGDFLPMQCWTLCQQCLVVAVGPCHQCERSALSRRAGTTAASPAAWRHTSARLPPDGVWIGFRPAGRSLSSTRNTTYAVAPHQYCPLIRPRVAPGGIPLENTRASRHRSVGHKARCAVRFPR